MARPSWIGYKLGGRYEIEALLGQGGMAAVYRATDPNLKRSVAVKLIHPHLSNDAAFVRRFEAEAAAVAQLRHARIIQVYDFAREEDVFYIVFEYLDGQTLKHYLEGLEARKQDMPFKQIVRIGSDMASALQYAHKRGLIHRDVKPANIMLNADGDAILMDFGIAKIAGGPQHTATGAIVGTVSYMAPEQVRGRKPDPRTDIYALGIVLFQMVAGRVPYEADSAMTLMMMQVQQPIPDLYQLRPDVPADLVRIIYRATEKDPADRYQSAGELLADLNRVRLDTGPPALGAAQQEEAVHTPPVGSLKAPPRRLSRATPPPSRPVTSPPPQAAAPVPPAAAAGASRPGSEPTGSLLSGRRNTLLGGCLALIVLFLCAVGVYALFGTPLGDAILGRASDETPAATVGAATVGAATQEAEAATATPSENGPATAVAIGAATATATATAETLASATSAPADFTATATQAAAAPTLRPTNTPTTVPTREPTAAPTHTPTQAPPTPTTAAAGPSVRIDNISLSGDRYIVSYSTVGYTEALPGMHVHFFFNTVPPEQAGLPNDGPWYVWGGPRPFDRYTQGDRPGGASQMCALVANPDHSIILGTGNCANLP